ncbi:MAG TPA: carbohydrate porin [Rhizomicrobium sp.]|nr:carbohydrate porin [Rhizomicrobium sp.]
MRIGIFVFCLLLSGPTAQAQDWAVHGQATFVEQFHPAFRAPFSGPSSLFGGAQGRETLDATLFLGAQPWDGGEAWADAEMDQGFGLSNTLGVAAFPSAEAYKVGKSAPYGRLQRLFFRQTFDLGGDVQEMEGGPNQFGGTRTSDNLVLTGGKFSVTDIFDTNSYAHDARGDFFNWGIVDAGAFDYAADAWGYSYGVAAEYSFAAWTLRGGLFDLSRVPNTTELESDFSQFELVGELERRIALFGQGGKIKLLGFVNRGRMGAYKDAVALAAFTGMPADTSLVRHYRSRPGAALNVEQGLSEDLGFFLRASLNDGSQETYEFTDMDQSISTGLSLKGAAWDRKDDTVGLAFETSAISRSARAYLATGGLGLLIGDGRLMHYADELVVESYYDVQICKGVDAALDYQIIANPAYNADRGPVSVLGVRLHGEF